MAIQEEKWRPSGAELLQMFRGLGDGKTMADMLNYPKAKLEALYIAAYNCYTQAKYERASQLFGVLIGYNHLDRRSYLGIAASLHMQRQFEDAIKYYGIASTMDLSDPGPVYHIAECQLALRQVDNARKTLLFLRDQVCSDPRFSGLAARVDGVLALIEKHDCGSSKTEGEQA